MVVIIDYGMGNVRSVEKACKRINQNVIISNELDVIKNASKLILPGVGHFSNGTVKLRQTGIWDALQSAVIDSKIPILGICLGMQLMTKTSEEGNTQGFGWIDAVTKKFPASSKLKIPHMGWNTTVLKKKSKLTDNLNINAQYYFVHSYYVECSNQSDVLLESYYINNFVSGFQKNNIYGVQFHPEKSHGAGLELISNFINTCSV